MRRRRSRLTAVGGPALPGLTRASADPDAEVRQRALDCRHVIESGPEANAIMAAARSVAEQKPAGAARVLLDYLPSRVDEAVLDQLRAALTSVAVAQGRADPAIVRALADPSAARRAAAGVALCRAGDRQNLPAVRKLLQDADPEVRLRVGLALADLGEKEAVPVLIALLDVLPRNLLAPVEDLLYPLAGEKAPALALGDDAAAHRKFRAAWAHWWANEGAHADLRRARETPYLDHTVVLLLDKGKMIELDADDRPVWEMSGLGFPLDLQVLPGERVLVADNQGGRVVERHRSGVVLWEKDVISPIMAQRLPNGRTFIATRTELLEVDRAGTIVFSYVQPDGEEFMRAAKLPDGDIVCIVGRVPRQRHFVRLDAAGREKARFMVDVQTSGGRIDVQPDGRVLIPQWRDNRVTEYDAAGRALRQFTVEQPIAALRLPNGNTLITSMSEQRAVRTGPGGQGSVAIPREHFAREPSLAAVRASEEMRKDRTPLTGKVLCQMR